MAKITYEKQLTTKIMELDEAKKSINIYYEVIKKVATLTWGHV